MERKIERIEDLTIMLEGEEIGQTLGEFVAEANADPELDYLDPRYAFACGYMGYNALSLNAAEVKKLNPRQIEEGLALLDTVNVIFHDREASVPAQIANMPHDFATA